MELRTAQEVRIVPRKHAINITNRENMAMVLKELEAIVDTLTSDVLDQVSTGLSALDTLLHDLLPSIRKYHQGLAPDSKLSAFLAAQDNFQYNVAGALLSAYIVFGEQGEIVLAETVILANRLLLGILLVHPESRKNFGHRRSMVLMVSFLDPKHPLFSIDVCVSFISLLVHILLQNVKNMRVFEQCGGCQSVVRHLDSKEGRDNGPALQNLSFKVIEFLVFYLTDETELGGVGETKSVAEKAGLFRPEFPGIDELIANLNDLGSL